MASRTQIRLAQVTGSFVDLKSEAVQYVQRSTASTLTGSDLQDVLGAIAGSLNRIHGAASSEPFNNISGLFRSERNVPGALTLKADAGANQTIEITNDEGTTTGGEGSGAIDIEATVGGISLHAADDKNIQIEGGTTAIVSNQNTSEAIKLHADAGASSTIQILNDEGTTDGSEGAGAIDIEATLGGISLHAADDKDIAVEGGQVVLTANHNTAASIKLHADAGSSQTIDLVNDEGTGAGAIGLLASAGGITIDGETGVSIKENGVEVIGVTTDRAVNLSVSGQATTVKGTFNVDEAATFDNNVTIAGNLDVNGTTTTIDTANMKVEDAIIAIGASGSNAYAPSNVDRGIIFGGGAVSAKQPALYFDASATRFVLATTATGPLSSSFGNADFDNGEGNILQLTRCEFATDGSANVGVNPDNGTMSLTGSAGLSIHAGSDSSGFLTITSAAKMDVDVVGDITLDSDSGVFDFADGGLTVGRLKNNASDFVIESRVSDKDIKFNGNDGGSGVTALLLDMSEGGNAEFANDVTLKSDDAVLKFGADADVTLTHIPDAAIRLNSTMEIQFNDAQEAISSTGTKLELKSGNQAFTLPTAAVDGQFLKSDGSGNLSFDSPSGATQKAIRVIGATVNAGTGVSTATADIQGGVQVDGLLTSATNQGKNLEVYVNGQLLASGSLAQRTANPPERDYEISGNKQLKFAFDLEADDIVQVIKR